MMERKTQDNIVSRYTLSQKSIKQKDVDKLQELYDLGIMLYVWHESIPYRKGLTEYGQALDKLLHSMVGSDNVLVLVPNPESKPDVTIVELDIKADDYGWIAIDDMNNSQDILFERMVTKDAE